MCGSSRGGKSYRPDGAIFFSASAPALPLSFGLDLGRGDAHDGGARNRRIEARIARTIGPVTATLANWKIMARARLTIRTPIWIIFSSKLFSDQSDTASDSSDTRQKCCQQSNLPARVRLRIDCATNGARRKHSFKSTDRIHHRS